MKTTISRLFFRLGANLNSVMVTRCDRGTVAWTAFSTRVLNAAVGRAFIIASAIAA